MALWEDAGWWFTACSDDAVIKEPGDGGEHLGLPLRLNVPSLVNVSVLLCNLGLRLIKRGGKCRWMAGLPEFTPVTILGSWVPPTTAPDSTAGRWAA